MNRLFIFLSLVVACDGGTEAPDAAHAPAAAPAAAPAPAAAAPAAAGATISSAPSGATVFVGGVSKGTAPVTLPASALPAKVEVRKDGFAAATLDVAGPGEVKATLEPGCARLVGYTGRFASGAALSPVDVARIDPSQYRVVRNEIFAQYGRAFKSEDLQAHFKATGWYHVNDAFTDDALSRVDQANVSLIKSFEGDAAQAKVMQRGQYTQGDSALQISEVGSAELVDMSGDIYNWDRQERYWQALGDWVVTWEGPSTWNPNDPSVRSAQLWKLNHDAGEVVEVFSL